MKGGYENAIKRKGDFSKGPPLHPSEIEKYFRKGNEASDYIDSGSDNEFFV